MAKATVDPHRAKLVEGLTELVSISKQLRIMISVFSDGASKRDADHLSTIFNDLIDAEISIARFV